MKVLRCWCASLLLAASAGAAPGDFAREHYRVSLAGICPSPFVIQKDWLAEAEHGGLYQLIGGAGKMSRGQYRGALGATGIELVILEGGRGIGLGDAETAYSALFMGNSKAGLLPHLAAHDLDNAFIFSRRFPAVGVVAMLDRSPSVIFWDPVVYPHGFHSIDDFRKFAAGGKGKIYVSTTRRTFGRYLVERGVPKQVFVEGFRGDTENFVLNNGHWLNQGTVNNEVYQLTHGNRWNKPLSYVLVSALGYDIYPSMISVAASRLQELGPCLKRLVPLLQQGQVDYVNDPAEVNELLFNFNQAGLGAPWWRTSRDLLDNSVHLQRDTGIVANGGNATLGDFDMARVASLLAAIRSTLDIRALPAVKPEDVVTNRFIDPSIGLRP